MAETLRGGERESPVRIAALASGRGSNFAAVAEAWGGGRLEGGELVALIVDRRETGAESAAAKLNVPVKILPYKEFPARAEYDAALLGELERLAPDLILTLGYMRLLAPGLTQTYAGRIINIHPSLLPAFPGMAAPRQALEYGVRIAGCTTHFVDDGVDTGPVILQAAVDVLPDDDEARLANRILHEEHRIIVESARLFCAGRLRIEGRKVRIEP